MLIRESSARLTLIELGDLARNDLPSWLEKHEESLREIVEWASSYLSRPHPEVGRKGHVCPFVKTSMNRELFYLAVESGVPESSAETAEALRGYRDWFVELARRHGGAAQYTTILVLFPDLPRDRVVEIVENTQELLKADYVSRGLMIGEFHDGPPAKGGLWNPEFRPLKSPVPLLAIRHMVPTDLPFLKDDPEQLAEYLRRYGKDTPPAMAARPPARERGEDH
ncbi:DUF6875 domain-containing protein [Streptomyces atratus]|uniref:DUF6875 domain-containing protein n=1 Tax=Streptomyces atratus TaxID=1893 RepID=UPI00225429BF|nr:hypothetical protein [Streptomyces atratus]MCX5340155.1 hypothetical protein [Streptomyces atratus]